MRARTQSSINAPELVHDVRCGSDGLVDQLNRDASVHTQIAARLIETFVDITEPAASDLFPEQIAPRDETPWAENAILRVVDRVPVRARARCT